MAVITSHVVGMINRVEEGRDPKIFIQSPTLDIIFERADQILTEVDSTDEGVVVVQTSADTEVVEALHTHADPVAALAAYQDERLEATTRIVLTNRTNPPDAILREVFERTGDRPFRAIDDVISREELAGLSEGYKRIAGYSQEALRG